MAIFSAVAAGERGFEAIAIAGGRRGEAPTDGFYPCGVCRQVMAEFAGEELVIAVSDGDGVKTYTLGDLLPAAFTKEKL